MNKTYFIDIDGVLIEHCGDLGKQATNDNPNDLYGSLAFLNEIDRNGGIIILTTGRRESMRKKTEEDLAKLGIFYNQLVMNCARGQRVIINDVKPSNPEYPTAKAYNIPRNYGLNFIFNDEFGSVENINHFTSKPWGYEKLITRHSDYIVKEIFMRSGERCSYQHHEIKHETIYCISGQLKTKIEESVLILEPGDYLVIPNLIKHSMEAIQDSIYIESSSNYINDVVRHEDKYGRV